MKTNSQRLHLGYLDGVRAWAALFVVLHHIWQFTTSGPDYRPLPRWFSAMTVFRFGAYAVAVFIVLSGYCLMLPVVRSRSMAFPSGLADFFARRLRRIVPAYYAALAFSVLLVAASPLVRSTHSQWDLAIPAFTAQNLLAHAALLHNWFQGLRWKLDPPLWTVALEWQIYFVFALVLLPVWRRFGGLVTVLSAFTLGLVPLIFAKGFVETWLIGGFALGMYAAGANFSPSPRVKRWIEAGVWQKISVAGAIMIGLVMVAHRFGDVPSMFSDTLVALTAMSCFIVSTDRLQRDRPLPWAMRVFAHPYSVAVGNFSYSVYLIHYPLIALLYISLRPLQLSPTATFGALLGCGLPAVLGTAYVFHRLFERPFMNRPIIDQPGVDVANELKETP